MVIYWSRCSGSQSLTQVPDASAEAGATAFYKQITHVCNKTNNKRAFLACLAFNRCVCLKVSECEISRERERRQRSHKELIKIKSRFQ